MEYTFLYRADRCTQRFIVPNQSPARSAFINQPNRIAKLRFSYDRTAPELLTLREDIILHHSASSLFYTLVIEESTLTVLSCVEREHSGEITLLNSGYPYLIFPETPNTTTSWSYHMRDDIHVDCCSRIVRASTSDTNLQLLHVQRRVCYNDGKVKDTLTVTESYLEDFGLQDVCIKSDNENKPLDR